MDKEKQQQPLDQADKSKVQVRSWKRLLSKKWVFPAVYLAAAALILALIFWYQNSNQIVYDKDDALPELVTNEGSEALTKTEDEEAVPVSTPETSFSWPVADPKAVKIAMGYYDDQASDEVKAAAMIQYGNGYFPNDGIDLTLDGKQSFDVLAAASGKVVRAEKDPVVGYIVEIEHADGRITSYQSLDGLKVKAGDQVNQGAVLGKAGRNAFEKDLGVHLHFEVRDGQKSINPLSVLPGQN